MASMEVLDIPVTIVLQEHLFVTQVVIMLITGGAAEDQVPLDQESVVDGTKTTELEEVAVEQVYLELEEEVILLLVGLLMTT